MTNKKFKIKVPATSANIGAGFDTLGIAFNIFNTFEVCELDENKLVIEGVSEEFQNEKNLVYQAMIKLFEKVNYKPKGIYIKETNDIPIGKGLGSSASCIIGGLVGANLIAGSPLEKDELYELSVEMEGHPDNVTPALFGGLTTSMMEKDKTLCYITTISKNFSFYASIPDFILPTVEAREILPKEYDKADVIYNISHALMTYLCLNHGQTNAISSCIGDKLHQPYRKNLIHGFDEISDKAQTLDALATYISGAGPTLIHITKSNNLTFEKEMRDWLKENYPGWEFKEVLPNYSGCIELENE